MPTSNKDKVPEELIRSLEAATSLMQSLLGDVKNNATSLAILKVRLESLNENVETLSHVVRDGNGKGSVITRMALVEKSLEHITESIDELKKETSQTAKDIRDEIHNEEKNTDKNSEFKRKRLLTKLQIALVVAPGSIALIIMLVKLIFGIE